LVLLREKMLQERQQAFLARQRTGLQELPKLVHLDRFIHVIQPAIGLFHRVLPRRLHTRFQFGARLHVDRELARQLEVNGIQLAREPPLRGEILHRGGWRHGFTIQLGTWRLNRADTRVFPGWYCTATTRASSSKDPSELRNFTISANSRVILQANNTSR